MENGKKPAFAQSENWQCDLEKHIQDPKKYGSPSFEGIGLTKREYFAGLAMQGYLNERHSLDNKTLAEWSVKMADALLAELEKTKKE
jgi:hypothetical protein